MNYEDLLPKELFEKQKEAFLKGDMGEVKEMAKVARTRLELPKQEDWQKAKEMIGKMDFPSDGRDFVEIKVGERHSEKKHTHELKTYKKWFKVLGFEAEAKYNYCENCAEVRNKVLRMFNNETGVVFERWFTYGGKDAKGKDIVELARDIFAVLVLLLVV